MLIAIITILFLGGGSSTGWLYDFGDMKAQTKAVIADDERKDAALDVVKEFKARSKAENKRLKALSKKVKNAVVDVNNLAKKQTANIAEIVTAERARLSALSGGAVLLLLKILGN